MTLYRFFLGHAKNFMFEFKDIKGMNIDFGPRI